MFHDDHETVLTNSWIICRFREISEVSGDFLLDFAWFFRGIYTAFMTAARAFTTRK